jgi:hypothetical protein
MKSIVTGRVQKISVLLAVLVWAVPVFGSEESLEEGPPPTTVEESPTSIDTSFTKFPTYGEHPKALKDKLKNTPAFIRDTKLDVNVRTFYMLRDNYDSSKMEAWALGGALSYQSGYFLDHFGVGAAFYTSLPLYAPSDRSGTLLLEDDQGGYATLGQLYGEIKIVDDVFLNLYRKEYNTPYINKNDNRMTPYTFEAYSLLGAYGGKDGAPTVRYGLGYFAKIKPKNAETFEPMSQAAGASVDRGVLAAGANYLRKEFSIGAVNYYCDDIINIFYAEGKYNHTFGNQVGLLLAAQYSDQRSTGNNLLTGASFFTNQVGIKSEFGYAGGLLTLAYTVDAAGADLSNPWSSYPGYTCVQVRDFNNANEEAFLVRLA